MKTRLTLLIEQYMFAVRQAEATLFSPDMEADRIAHMTNADDVDIADIEAEVIKDADVNTIEAWGELKVGMLRVIRDAAQAARTEVA